MRNLTQRAFFALVCLALSWNAFGEDWPSRTVRIVVPYSAGGGLDNAARILARELSHNFGQSVVVDPRPGGATVTGSSAVARAEPDGYTLLLTGSSTMSVLPFVSPVPLPFEPLKDFVPIGMVSRMPFFLVVPADSPYSTLAQLIDAGKANPNSISFATNGAGSMAHLGIERFLKKAGVTATHVPYPGFAPAMTDVSTGRVSFTMADIGALRAQLAGGRIKPLVVSSDARSSFLPNVPTFAESGVPDSTFEIWLGLFAPAGTPTTVVNRIAQAMSSYLHSDRAKADYEKLGQEPDGADGTIVRARIVAEQKVYAAVASGVGLARKP